MIPTHLLMSYVQTAVNVVRDMKRDERGVSALEYALIASFIGLAIISGATSFGSQLNGVFSRLGDKVSVLGN